jgi:hypothetical protein
VDVRVHEGGHDDPARGIEPPRVGGGPVGDGRSLQFDLGPFLRRADAETRGEPGRAVRRDRGTLDHDRARRGPGRARKATRSALAFLRERHGLPGPVALAYLSAAVDLRISQVVDLAKGVHCTLPKELHLD